MDKNKQNNEGQHENYMEVGMGLGAATGTVAMVISSWNVLFVPAGIILGMLIGMLIPKKK